MSQIILKQVVFRGDN